MATFEPVDFDPFAQPAGRENTVTVRPAAQRFEPVDHDPFAQNPAMGIAKAAGTGVAKGVIGMAGMVGDVAEGAAKVGQYALDKIGAGRLPDAARNALPSMESISAAAKYLGVPVDHLSAALETIPQFMRPNPLRTSADIQKDVEQITGPFYKPQNTAEEYAQTIGEFAPAAATGPQGVIRRGMQVLIPAVASETAGQATKGGPLEPYARLGAALTGGAAASIAARPSTAARAVREQLPEGVTPQMVTQAEGLMQEAAGRGIQLAWPEALSQVAGRPVLTNTMRHLEASPQTEGRMAEFFGQRPQQVERAARAEFDNVAPVNQNPSTIGREVGRAAEAEVDMTRGAINAASEPFYQRAETILLTPQEMQRVRAVPGFEEARQAVRNDPQLNRYVANLPDDSIGFLNEVKKYLDTAAENARGAVNPQRNMQRAAGYGNDAETVRNMARQVDAQRGGGDYGLALDIQQRGREQVLQPLLDGYIGKLAQRDQSTQKAINALFPQKPLPNSQAEIGQAVTALGRHNQRAARDLVRAYVEQAFNQTARDLQTGPNQAGGAKFRAALVGDSQQAANLEAAISALPNGRQRWDGFNRLLDMLEATGTW